MNIRQKLADNLYSAFFALCAVLLTEGAMLRLADISAPIACGITSVIFMTATVFVYINRKNAAVYIGVFAIAALIVWALNSLGVPIADYFALTAEHFIEGETLETGELILLCSVLSLLLSALLFPLSKLIAARLALAVTTLCLMVFYGINGIVIDPVESFAAAGLVISSAAELSLTVIYRKEPRNDLRGVLSFLLPLFAALSIAVSVIPSSSSAISWRVVRTIASAIAETVESIAADISLMLNPALSEFSIGMQGYSDSGDIDGTLSSNTTCQLGVTENSRLRSSVYLIGSVSDIYDRDGWKKSEYGEFPENDYYLDYCETMLAFERAGYTREMLETFTARTGLSVRYRDILTKTVFYPLKTVEISQTKLFDASAPNIMLNGRAEQGSSYAVRCLELNYRSSELQALLHDNFSYNAENVTSRRELDKQLPENIEESLSKRADYRQHRTKCVHTSCLHLFRHIAQLSLDRRQPVCAQFVQSDEKSDRAIRAQSLCGIAYIKNIYTVLPEFITDRTQKLAEQITEGCTDDYSRLSAIEAYLRGYSYTLSPGNVPEGYDAVDYFLFESHEGYCTYFASAMAVLGRCVGIPTRYVQGFALESSEMELREEYSVPASAAHAWTEAYIEGFGWVPFEPTATRAETRYGFEGTLFSGDTAFDFNYDELFSYDETEKEVVEEEVKDDSSLYIIIVCLAVGGTGIIVLCYLALKIRAYLKRYKAGNDTEKFLTCYGLILKLFTKSKLVRESGETADHFAKRANEAFPEDEISFTTVTEEFDKIRYGGALASFDERNGIESYLRALLTKMQKKKGRFAGIAVLIGCSLGSKKQL